MSNPTGIFNDVAGGANMPIGSQVVQINSISYILDDWDPKETSKEIDRTNELGVPSDAAYIRQKIKGSGTLQLATSTSAIPTQFMLMTASYRGASKKFILTEVGLPQKAGEEIKVPISFAEQLNGS